MPYTKKMMKKIKPLPPRKFPKYPKAEYKPENLPLPEKGGKPKRPKPRKPKPERIPRSTSKVVDRRKK